MAKVKIQVDGREVEVEEGLNLIEAARAAGVEIPHFCYHPGLGVDGNCRQCLIEVEGVPKLQIACNSYAKEGLAIRTTTERVAQIQAGVLEFLFLNHPLDCPICDQSGECLLQDYYISNGKYTSRLDTDKVHKRKAVPIGERVMLDAERCVLCTRCIRFCDQVTKTGELRIVNRGNRSEITTYPGRPLDNDYSLNTVDVCPVGALTSRDFRFRKRVWHLQSAKSLCTGCARGCNTYLESDDGKIYRYRPRENMQVNDFWMCDPGRLSYTKLNEDRLDVAITGTEMRSLPESIEHIGTWINVAVASGRAEDIVVLVSPQSSTETLFAAKRFASEVLGGARIGGKNLRPDGIQDELLRRADQNPNSRGVEMLGLVADPAALLSSGGTILLVIDDDPLGYRPELKVHFAKFEHVVYLGSWENETSRSAELALPVTPHSECDGTFVNFEGRVQRFRKALTPRGDALWLPTLLARFAEFTGQEFGWKTAGDLWTALRGSEAAFSGIDYSALGEVGLMAGSGQPASAAAE